MSVSVYTADPRSSYYEFNYVFEIVLYLFLGEKIQNNSLPGCWDTRTEVKATAEINNEHRISALTASHRVLAVTIENT